MIRQIVKDYEIVADIERGDHSFSGDSSSEKRMIFHVLKDKTVPAKVLDIGFGTGTLGSLVKMNPETSHWEVDGVDGFDISCKNLELFGKKHYRNIWHGYAQELGAEQLKQYDIICLLDVIEHLDVPMARQLMRNLLESLREDAYLFISTPLWFYPQDSQREGDLEEHLIGIPASSMMALQPLMYTVGPALVGCFVYSRRSLDYADLFQPTTDRGFSIERGMRVAAAVGMKMDRGVVYYLS